MQAALAYPGDVGACNSYFLYSTGFLSIIQFAGKLPCEETVLRLQRMIQLSNQGN